MMEPTWEDYTVTIIIGFAIFVFICKIYLKLYIRRNYDIIILRDNNGNVIFKRYKEKIDVTRVV